MKVLLRLLEKLFWTNSSFWLLEKDFFSCGNRLLYYFTRELFSTSGSHHFICLGEISLLFRDSLLLVETGKSKFWKINWFLLLGTDFLASGNHLYLPFSDTPGTASFIFQSNENVVLSEFCIPVRRNRFFWLVVFPPIFFRYSSWWKFFLCLVKAFLQQIFCSCQWKVILLVMGSFCANVWNILSNGSGVSISSISVLKESCMTASSKGFSI